MRLHWQLAALCAAALAACSVDAVTFTQPGEDCEAAGDEDGNGQADCGDPACAGATSCQLACGNGRAELGEACDDGNAIDGDGCDRNCTVTGCGNGIRTAGEVCDDGNLINGDGCEDTCQGTGSGSYEATADATIRISSGTLDASTNFGTRPELFTFASSFGTTARSLLAFDLATVPVGPPIEAAHLYVFMVDQAGIDYSIEVREVGAPWSETSVTWNTQPGFGPVVESSLPFQGTNRWWRFDVTALVRRWVAAPAPIRSLLLRQSPESFPSGGQFARFDSREGVNRPYLDIVVGI
jgi:cysteine-rich repeat protein